MAIHTAAEGGLGGKSLMETNPSLNHPKNVESKIPLPKEEKTQPTPEPIAAPGPASKPTAQLLKRFEPLPPVLHQALADNHALRTRFQEIQRLTGPQVPLEPGLPTDPLGKPAPIHENPRVHPLPRPSTSANITLSPIKTETVARNPIHGDNGSKIKVNAPEKPLLPARNDNSGKGLVPIGHLLDLKL